jgi:23S rRNA pseudouridine2605 synthase
MWETLAILSPRIIALDVLQWEEGTLLFFCAERAGALRSSSWPAGCTQSCATLEREPVRRLNRRPDNIPLAGKMARNKSPVRTGLARALSKLGYCSRSQAANLIRAGKVCLNGLIVRDPERPVLPTRDKISVEGREVSAERKIYLMMNKPRGLVTTARDDKGRDTIYSLLPECRQWLGPVGRLDKASEGLLLCTNDWIWAEKIASPETHLEKTYHAQIGTVADENLLNNLSAGVASAEGEFLRAKSAKIVRHGARNSWLEIVLDEGKNRHIRRMLDALNIKVLRLVRIAIGPLQLGDLAKGAVRELTKEDRRSLDSAMDSSIER